MAKIRLILLSKITRKLKYIKGLHSPVYLVGGVVNEGGSLHDIDFVYKDIRDVPKIKKALGKFAKFAHFSYQENEPPAPIYLKITGRKPKSPDLFKSRPMAKNEYAN